MKRFTETSKWSDPWFSQLDPKNMLLWLYILDQTDNAGVWDPNRKHAEFCTGTKYDWNKVALAFDLKVRVLKNGRWWIPGFIKYQFGDIFKGNDYLRKSCVILLHKHGLTDFFFNGTEATERGKSDLTESQPLALNFDPPKKQEKEQAKFVPPTLAEIEAYATERGSTVNPKAFWEYFQNGSPPWTDSKGKPVRSWKQKFITWDNNDSGRTPPPPTFPLPKFSN